MNTSELLKQLIELFDRSTMAYRQYLAAGKTFQFAQELKLYNSKALQLLIDNKQSMPEELQEDIQSLITHYTEWSQKWEKLAAEKEHQPDDVFVFANDITFPRQAAQNLESAYQSLL
jgi:hypothetical protein